MRETDLSAAPFVRHPTWAALSRYIIGPEGAAFGFADRLARENGWSRDLAERVVGEYRRFCFLATVAGHAVTPSDAVDQAWHLHLTYTRDYWELFCPDVLGGPLHHAPTEGGAGDRARFFEQYGDTLRSYERVFGELAPEDIWPSAERRFVEDPKARRFHPRDGFLVTRRQARLAAAAATLFVMLAIMWFTQGG